MDISPFVAAYHNQTTTHPTGLVILCFAILWVFLVKRELVGFAFVVIMCFIAPAQRIVVVGADFTFLRILTVVAVARFLLCREFAFLRHSWNALDRVIVAYALIAILPYVILHGTAAALIYRLGFGFDTIGFYIVFRVTIRERADVERIVHWFIAISIPVLLFFIVESRTGYNMFSAFGGVPETTLVRYGRLRVQGAFAHPILAGSFWAVLVPLIVDRFLSGRSRIGYGIAILSTVGLVLLAASSTPLASLAIAVFAIVLFPIRLHMRAVRWSLLGAIVALDIVMEARVWHLISRIDLAGGSTGWHRYFLIDQWIQHFDEWWLIGVRSTEQWGAQLIDVTNQYVGVATNGGIVALTMFIIVICVAFRNVGQAIREMGQTVKQQRTAWLVGVALLIHVINFIGVSYFGQIDALFWATVALTQAIRADTCCNEHNQAIRSFATGH